MDDCEGCEEATDGGPDVTDDGAECGWGVEVDDPLDGWRDSMRGGKLVDEGDPCGRGGKLADEGDPSGREGKLADEGEPSGRGDGIDPPGADTGVRTGLRSGGPPCGGAPSSRVGRRSPGRGAGAEKPTSTRGVPLGLIILGACGLVGPAGAPRGVPAPEPGWR